MWVLRVIFSCFSFLFLAARCSPLIIFFDGFELFACSHRAARATDQTTIINSIHTRKMRNWRGALMEPLWLSPPHHIWCDIKKMFNTCLEFWIPFAIDLVVEYPALWPGTMYSAVLCVWCEDEFVHFFVAEEKNDVVMSSRPGRASQQKVTTQWFCFFLPFVVIVLASSSASCFSVKGERRRGGTRRRRDFPYSAKSMFFCCSVEQQRDGEKSEREENYLTTAHRKKSWMSQAMNVRRGSGFNREMGEERVRVG